MGLYIPYYINISVYNIVILQPHSNNNIEKSYGKI